MNSANGTCRLDRMSYLGRLSGELANVLLFRRQSWRRLD